MGGGLWATTLQNLIHRPCWCRAISLFICHVSSPYKESFHFVDKLLTTNLCPVTLWISSPPETSALWKLVVIGIEEVATSHWFSLIKRYYPVKFGGHRPRGVSFHVNLSRNFMWPRDWRLLRKWLHVAIFSLALKFNWKSIHYCFYISYLTWLHHISNHMTCFPIPL